MTSDKSLRDHLLFQLKGGHAHMSLTEAADDFPEKHMNDPFPNGTYTPWHLLEHIRITQWDILDFIRNPDYKEIAWPDSYWPEKNKKATKKEWNKSIAQFEKDILALQKIVANAKIDLHAKIPHGTGQTILKEILVVTDHNAYHIGEFAIMREAMKTWSKKH